MPSQADHLHKISYACSNTSQFYLSYNLHLRARHVSLFLHLPCSTAFFMIRLNATQWGSIFALFAAFLFSTKAIFIKQAYALSPLVDATVLMALRMASALPFFLLIFAGLMGYYFSSWLDFLGLMFISASLERIILFLYPTLTVLASSVMYRQKLSWLSLFAITLSYGGTVIVMLQEQSNTPHDTYFWLGSSLVFASAVCFAGYLLLTKSLIQHFGSWNFTGLALSIACIGTLTHYSLVTPNPLGLIQQLPVEVLGYGIALGIFVTVLPTLLMAHSIARLGAAQSAMIASIGPILTIFLATAFLGEHLNGIQWFSYMLNIIDVMVFTLFANKFSH